MPLTGAAFYFFVAAAAAAHRLAPPAWRAPLLLVASYAWYASLDVSSLPWLLAATIVDYLVARAMESAPARRMPLLLLSLAVNGGMLAYFKLSPALAPIGISFFTFHSLSYVFDVFRGEARAERSLLRYAVFVAFFPKLLAGPIERFRDFREQLGGIPGFAELTEAVLLATFGLYLKLVVGDSLALIAARTFDAPALVPGGETLLGIYAYSAQIYADFLGYTLIARGTSLAFGIRLDPNFLRPYLATTPQEFWRRWHRSLSFWFRDYLYIPLGGNRRAWARNVAVTMLVAGAWHGASPKYVAWGAYHAALVIAGLVLQRLLGPRLASVSPRARNALRLSAWLVTSHAVCLGWVFFRAADLSSAFEIFARLARWPAGGADPSDLAFFAVLVAPWAAASALYRHLPSRIPAFASQNVAVLTAGVCLLLTFIFGDPVVVPFLYFKF